MPPSRDVESKDVSATVHDIFFLLKKLNKKDTSVVSSSQSSDISDSDAENDVKVVGVTPSPKHTLINVEMVQSSGESLSSNKSTPETKRNLVKKRKAVIVVTTVDDYSSESCSILDLED